MTIRFTIYCPYCGATKTDDRDLLQLQGEVYSLFCDDCKKSCVLALYDIEIWGDKPS